MFEFGKDLRKLFAQARESLDLGWLELVPVGLVESEARQQTAEAGRMACPRPAETWLRAAALWREHARRSGVRTSLERAFRAGRHACISARGNDDLSARIRIDTARTHLLAFDLCGDPARLDRAVAQMGLPTARRAHTIWAARAVFAQVALRKAGLGASRAEQQRAFDEAAAALHGKTCADPHLADELRLDRAAVALELGVISRDTALLDQAGRDLRTLVDTLSSDSRPLSRARALALCGKGLSVLASMADDATAAQQGVALFEAAADQFTPDHSPLDWVVMTLMRGNAASTAELAQAEALTLHSGLVIGALARELRTARDIAHAEQAGDINALNLIEHRLRRRIHLSLASPTASPALLDWAADQIGSARLALARARMTPDGPAAAHVGLILVEAAQTAREQGASALADRAEQTLAAQTATQAPTDAAYRFFNWNAPR